MNLPKRIYPFVPTTFVPTTFVVGTFVPTFCTYILYLHLYLHLYLLHLYLLLEFVPTTFVPTTFVPTNLPICTYLLDATEPKIKPRFRIRSTLTTYTYTFIYGIYGKRCKFYRIIVVSPWIPFETFSYWSASERKVGPGTQRLETF